MESIEALGDLILAWAQPNDIPNFTKDWPLGRFKDAFIVANAYLAFVLIGSFVMKRVSFDAKGSSAIYGLSFAYNIVQVMLCSYMTIHASVLAYRSGYSVVPCNEVFLDKPVVAELLWLFYISKVLDFMDTFFIILKKNWKQLSFLHVYHHYTIFLIYWLNLRANYDGDVYITIVLNGFIHSIMYTYYFVSLHTKKIWWKPALTAAQLIQFTFMMTQGTLVLTATNCGTMPSRQIARMYFFYILSLFVLFSQFFMNTYMKPHKQSRTKASPQAERNSNDGTKKTK